MPGSDLHLNFKVLKVAQHNHFFILFDRNLRFTLAKRLVTPTKRVEWIVLLKRILNSNKSIYDSSCLVDHIGAFLYEFPQIVVLGKRSLVKLFHNTIHQRLLVNHC